VCDRLCFELEKHVKLAHKIDIVEYELMADQEKSADENEFSCYISDCNQCFKKEADLLVHIDIKHANEDEKEKMKVKNSILRKSEAFKISSKLFCKVCGASYSSRSSLWGHVTRTHSLTWQDYESSYGHVENDIETLEPFNCKICGKNIKNERNVIVRHVKAHGMNWKKYVENYVKNNNFVQQEEQSDTDLVKTKDTSLSPGLRSPPGPPTINGIVKLENPSRNVQKKSSEYTNSQDFMVKLEEQCDVEPVKINFVQQKEQIDEELVSIMDTAPAFDPITPPGPLSSNGLVKLENPTEIVKKKSLEITSNQDFMVTSKLMNVTDKGLKSCTRCNLDFPSRLRFIRHCQLAHKMKFKLKNGDKLVLP